MNLEDYLHKLNTLLDDLRGADIILREMERQYGLASDVFYELYMQGAFDTGENLADVVKWAGCYELSRAREQTLRDLSLAWIQSLRQQTHREELTLAPLQPVGVAYNVPLTVSV